MRAHAAKCGNTDWCEVLNSRTLKKTHRHDATLEQAWTSVDRQHRCSAITHQIVAIVVVGRVVSSHGAPVVVRSCRAVMQTHARKHKHTQAKPNRLSITRFVIVPHCRRLEGLCTQHREPTYAVCFSHDRGSGHKLPVVIKPMVPARQPLLR
jgi:hypothetical protein